MIIAIDGPAGSGKSTVAKEVAKQLNITYIDTGAMYRMVALKSIREHLDYSNTKEVKEFLENIDLKIVGNDFILDGENVTNLIRTQEIGSIASKKIAVMKEVREKLVEKQREISKGKSVVMDGRDIGTVVFPNADYKFFLVASKEQRAKRREQELIKKGIEVDFNNVLEEIKQRDEQDINRKESPLKKAEDAFEIDTTKMNIGEVIDKIISIVNK